MKSEQVIIYIIVSLTLQRNWSTAELTDTLKHCCDLGTNWSNQNLKCSKFQSPVAGVLEEEQDFCIHSVTICCTRNHRSRQCTMGQDAAKMGKKCIPPLGTTDDYFKVLNINIACCEACNKALSLKGSGCDSSGLGLKNPAEGAFKECCEEIALTTTTTVNQTTPTSTQLTTSQPTTQQPTTPQLTTLQPITTQLTTNKSTTMVEISSTMTPGKYKPSKNKGIGNFCELLYDQLCAQICIPTADSYRCDCRPGYVLMKDKKSCMPKNVPNRCERTNPCDHICTDTGVAIQCSCDSGYRLLDDKRTCKDIDECILNTADCKPGQLCVNTKGSYTCDDYLNPTSKLQPKCPEGYYFNKEKKVCDDIDECALNLSDCSNPEACENKIGSYICKFEQYSDEKDDDVSCPPGLYFKASVETCQDIDECASATDDCNRDTEVCLNTHGSFICKNLGAGPKCPPGFRMDFYTHTCIDINECQENPDLCATNEECVDEPGGYKCLLRLERPPVSVLQNPLSRPQPPQHTSIAAHRTTTTTTTSRPRTPLRTTTITTTTTSIPPLRPPVYRQKSHSPLPSIPQSSSPPVINIPFHNSKVYPSTQINSRQNFSMSCARGLTYSDTLHRCVDINECEEDSPCDSTQDCRNTVGSYKCICKIGYELNPITLACEDVNECQRNMHNCFDSQRCDNTVGSFTCFRLTSCGTGYTLNAATGHCEDDDECLLGQHNCDLIGPKWECKNTLGSFRCEKCYASDCSGTPNNVKPSSAVFLESKPNYKTITNQFKKCLPGYLMNSRGVCIDVNECEQRPTPCGKHETCVNTQGSFRCMSKLQCKMGYELDESASSCVDINECARGTHQCTPGQICINKEGFHLCQCPPGHKVNRLNECEDLDECELYKGRICPQNADCENTVGSYRCVCKAGFSKEGKDNSCTDVDECVTRQGLCEHNCINTWGSFRCACKPGFTLNEDNRTCADMDECTKFKDSKLCVGSCENVPGSYRCKCPEGYRLGVDGRTCQDIDECQQGDVCLRDNVCLNTRGGYQCQSIVCPINYIRDPLHKNRCKRANNYCSIHDIQCIRSPSSYSYNFITFVSNVPLPMSGQLDLFTLRGPLWDKTTAMFKMEFKRATCANHVRKASSDYFRMSKTVNQATLSLIRPIEGPQEVELQLAMEYYNEDKYVGLAMAKVFIYVSEYEF